MNNINNTNRVLKRGELYWAELPYLGKDSKIQQGKRPILVVSNNMANRYSPVVQYLPTTSSVDKMIKKGKFPAHVMLESSCLPNDSMALVEQLGIVDTFRIGDKIGTLSHIDTIKINVAIIMQLGMNMLQMVKDVASCPAQ